MIVYLEVVVECKLHDRLRHDNKLQDLSAGGISGLQTSFSPENTYKVRDVIGNDVTLFRRQDFFLPKTVS